ncbi:sensor histidine kinase [Pseudothauera rhizosphaerae]|uniref:histidine kinase n=1 Tax=Pseudothauera rhizosphaerae TaxID=2565932 RepID=A0A4S4AQ15_9RHOO|nr:PAS domain-containing sensor histidine kinase [Pseudothauera rhizosphaerae]THF60523.1 PAS domain S-box protein [Pseudothauera rhizosphaerae]
MDLAQNKLTEITFQLIVDSAPGSIVLVNGEGLIAYVNRQCENLFGYSAQELIGKPVEELIPERFRQGHGALRTAYARAPTLRSMGIGRELFALRKDGTEFPVEIGLNPLVLVDGIWILATIIDITERKQAEARFRKVVESAPSAMILVNQNGLITLVNQQAVTLFGYAESEILGQPVEILLPDELRGHHGALRDSFFANPQTRYMGSGRDLLARRKDGTVFPVEVGLNPIQTEGGVVALASVVDITARRVQEELRAKKEAAEAAYKAKGELLAIASHDLKNPLAAIAGLAEILLEMKKGEPTASQQDLEFLQNIYDASNHMSEVVKGILESEGIEQLGLAFDEKGVDLSALGTELVRYSQSMAKRKRIRLVGDIQPDIVVRGDATRLREALDNYVSNAIKYSPPDKTVEVTLATVADGAQVEFGVRDQGPGLSDDDKAKLFGKFRKLSAKPTGGESSTGLGLSIVKTIIELHQGTVGCDSRLGEGAYFWARLPRN